MLDAIVNLWNILLVVIAFGAVIFIHEMGHFLAAKWAGIKVHAFAVGFGSAIVSWRKGMGLRRGSSEAEYDKLIDVAEHAAKAATPDDKEAAQKLANATQGISETEYRLNWFPFGGYVRMLGQEDGNPEATSEDPASYTAKPVYKRMVVISAGVAMNVILAAMLFVGVFLAGLRTEAPVVGSVEPGGAGDVAGIEAGDVILSINGRNTETFQDVFVGVAMAAPGEELLISVARDGASEPVVVTASPVRDELTGFRQLGITPGVGVALRDTQGVKPAALEQYRAQLDAVGLAGVAFDAQLVEVEGGSIAAIESSGGAVFAGSAMGAAAARSGGESVRAVYESASSGERYVVELAPEPAYQIAMRRVVEGKKEKKEYYAHLLGLVPVMGVDSTIERGFEQGLREGDVFARIGGVVWPSMEEGKDAIKAHAGEELEIEVIRDGGIKALVVHVSKKGQIGFNIDQGFSRARVTGTPWESGESGESIGLVRGAEIVSVDGAPVGSFEGVFRAIREKGGSVVLGVHEPGADTVRDVEWVFGDQDAQTLAGIGWQLDRVTAQMSLAQVTLKADGAIDALAMGIKHTHLKIEATYLTFLRMIDGSVPVNQVSGPVGIVHIGSRVAARGMLHLLFLMAIVSANLAVINFLPFPVVDGGHFVMLMYEGITRRAVPIRFQNAVTMVGLVVIVGVFLFVTFNDLARWFGGS